jgi:hypothetical protein
MARDGFTGIGHALDAWRGRGKRSPHRGPVPIADGVLWLDSTQLSSNVYLVGDGWSRPATARARG